MDDIERSYDKDQKTATLYAVALLVERHPELVDRAISLVEKGTDKELEAAIFYAVGLAEKYPELSQQAISIICKQKNINYPKTTREWEYLIGVEAKTEWQQMIEFDDVLSSSSMPDVVVSHYNNIWQGIWQHAFSRAMR